MTRRLPGSRRGRRPGFTLAPDEYQPEQDKRWVLVAPPGAGDNAATLLLARAATAEQPAFTGGRRVAL
jgi:hypothetical protein